jgi:hypothetical protein
MSVYTDNSICFYKHQQEKKKRCDFLFLFDVEILHRDGGVQISNYIIFLVANFTVVTMMLVSQHRLFFHSQNITVV